MSVAFQHRAQALSDIARLRYSGGVNPYAADEAPIPENGAPSRAEQRLNATFDAAAVGIAHVGLDGRSLRVNDRLCEFLGYSRNELLACTFAEIAHPDDLEADMARVNDLLTGRAAHYAMEKRYLRKDAAVVWANLSVALVRESSGAPDYFISVVEDITARRTLGERLAESNRQLRLALQAAKAGAWDWDVERNQLQWSEENIPLYGLAPQERMTFADWETHVHPDDRAASR